MDKLTAARYFLMVAQTGSFSKAARFYNLPVSTVSRRIKDLEEILGNKLFKRSTRFLSLTQVGETYFQHVEDAVKSFDLAEDIVRQDSGDVSGVIKVTALPSYARVCLFPLLQSFRNRYPEIIIDLNMTDQLNDLVRDKFDFAIRPTSTPPEHLIAKVIDKHKMMLVASQEYIDTHGPISDYSEVKNHRTLCYRGSYGAMPWYACDDGKWHNIERTPYYLCNDTCELLRNAIEGEGVALLPEWTVKESLKEGLIKQMNVGWEVSFASDLEHRLYLLYERKTTELKRNKLFLDHFMKNIERA